MIKKGPLFLFILAYASIAFGQATLSVDGAAVFEKTLSIGENLNSDYEMEIQDTDNDGLVSLKLKTNGHQFLTGLNSNLGNFYGTVFSDKYSFITNNTVRMILLGNGDLGIGTPDPSEKLHVRKDGVLDAVSEIVILQSAVSMMPTLRFQEGTNFGMSIQYDGRGFGDNNKLNILDKDKNAVVTISNEGNMGIQETNPTEALEINGEMVIDASDSENELRFYEAGNEQAKLAYSGTVLSMENSGPGGSVRCEGALDSQVEGTGDIILDAADKIIFSSGPITNGVLSNEGFFGINQTDPDGMLHVRAKLDDHAIEMENDLTSESWSWRVRSDDLEFYHDGVFKGCYNGNTGAYTTASDKRLKEDIEALEHGVLAKINRLEPSYYYFKRDQVQERKSVGLIAQDVLKVFPEIVEKPMSDTEYYGVHYSKLSVLAVKALQEQQEEIEWIKKEIEKRLAMKEKIRKNRVMSERLTVELSNLKQLEVKE